MLEHRLIGLVVGFALVGWDNAWAEFIPFLDYDVEIRGLVCSTNAIELLNARYRRAIEARGHFRSSTQR